MQVFIEGVRFNLQAISMSTIYSALDSCLWGRGQRKAGIVWKTIFCRSSLNHTA